ncbi:MAG: hypothetical protein COV59_05570 [Candidatus Magasanikbacteria bacterium CG11_big_fil_rev_8_21_14_0_20_39_34]|uniref:DUF3899 domain-containing protein n=1 Tax=Candidatus Magasanikbacteria bacterium CG11_big_fil_rev_8_21_14_0_20_39_34 TaxID=1974653 RepID=A0A2H0N408_9BACT|nr:MAG: hypothetical protein COV59_05570 [Candidatus Magasanikbacteria bacterium CG11_big_fil_rev_8_21_14_0_20_39_34]
MLRRKKIQFEHYMIFFKEISVVSAVMILFLLTIIFFVQPNGTFFLKYCIPIVGVLCGVITIGFSGWMFVYCLEGYIAKKLLLHGGDFFGITKFKGKTARFWAVVGMVLSIYFAILCLLALFTLFFIFIFLAT